MPQNIEAERAVLGSVLLNNAALIRVTGVVSADHFSQRGHRTIFATMRRLGEQQREIDLLTVKDELTKTGELDNCGGSAYISSLIDGIPDIANVERYARIVREKAALRLAQSAGLRLAAFRDEADLRDADEQLQLAADAIRDARLQNESASNCATRVSSLIPLSDFLAEPPVAIDWLVDGLLPAGGIGLLSAKPKVGKSTLSRDLMCCVARGEPFLSRHVTQGRIVYLALEDHRDRLREELQRLGLNGDDDIFIHVGPAPNNGVAWLAGLINEHRPALTVIDPFLKLVRVSDANAYAETSAALEPLTSIARGSGCCLLLVHHGNKSIADGGESVLGSTSIIGLADTVMLMKRRDDQTRTMNTIQRYGDDMSEAVLSMNSATGHLALAGSYREMKLEEVISRIAEVLRTRPLMTESEIRQVIGGDSTVVAEALRRAVVLRIFGRTGRGKKGSPYRYEEHRSILAS